MNHWIMIRNNYTNKQQLSASNGVLLHYHGAFVVESFPSVPQFLLCSFHKREAHVGHGQNIGGKLESFSHHICHHSFSSRYDWILGSQRREALPLYSNASWFFFRSGPLYMLWDMIPCRLKTRDYNESVFKHLSIEIKLKSIFTAC